MYLPSRLQKYAGIGRVVSAVIGFALSKDSSVPLTQTLRVPLNGLIKAMNLPSGEICAPEISGSPKKSSRSIMGGGVVCWPRETFGNASAVPKKLATARTLIEAFEKKLRLREIILEHLMDGSVC